MNKEFNIDYIKEGKNSVLLETSEGFVFYEKLLNSIHSGDESKLKELQDRIESADYNPLYESDSLKKRRGEKLEGLVLNVTESCNLGCRYCIYSGNYKNERKNNAKEMSLDTAVNAINLFMNNAKNPAPVSFYGGEPLNNMKLIKEIINYTKKEFSDKTFLYSMTSNFYNADKYLSEIVDNKIQVLISLDGPKEIHDKHRITTDGKPTWGKIISNIEKLKEYSPEYVKQYLGQSVTCADPNDTPKIIDFFRDEENFRAFRIGGIELNGLKRDIIKKDNSSLLYNLAGEFLEKIVSEEKIPGIINLFFDQKLRFFSQRDMKQMPESLMLSGACYPGNRKLFVDADGDLYMCEKFGKRVSIGNAKTGLDYNSIDDSIDKFKEIRNQVCTNNCWAQRVCMPCIQIAKDFDSDISKESLAETCNNSKKEIMLTLALYSSILKSNKKFMERYAQSDKCKGVN